MVAHKKACSFPKDRQKFPIVFILLNADLWSRFQIIVVDKLPLLRKTNIRKSEVLHHLLRQIQFFWANVCFQASRYGKHM